MGKTVEDYLKAGYDYKAAVYFANGRRTLLKVIPNDDFTLTLYFDNGEKRFLDMRPDLKKGTVFEPIMQLEAFRRVYLDENDAIS